MLAASTAAVAPRPVVVLPRLPVIPLPVLLSFLPPLRAAPVPPPVSGVPSNRRRQLPRYWLWQAGAFLQTRKVTMRSGPLASPR
jgi:hypothetical protein